VEGRERGTLLRPGDPKKCRVAGEGKTTRSQIVHVGQNGRAGNLHGGVRIASTCAFLKVKDKEVGSNQKTALNIRLFLRKPSMGGEK